jgi:hypothetical protein
MDYSQQTIETINLVIQKLDKILKTPNRDEIVQYLNESVNKLEEYIQLIKNAKIEKTPIMACITINNLLRKLIGELAFSSESLRYRFPEIITVLNQLTEITETKICNQIKNRYTTVIDLLRTNLQLAYPLDRNKTR